MSAANCTCAIPQLSGTGNKQGPCPANTETQSVSAKSAHRANATAFMAPFLIDLGRG